MQGSPLPSPVPSRERPDSLDSTVPCATGPHLQWENRPGAQDNGPRLAGRYVDGVCVEGAGFRGGQGTAGREINRRVGIGRGERDVDGVIVGTGGA